MNNKILHWVKLSSIIFALSTLFASCSNEWDHASQPDVGGNLQFVVSDFPAFGENPQTRASSLGTPDEGKTAWVEGDVITVRFISEYFNEQTATLTYDGSAWTSSASFTYIENETPTVTAVYNPSATPGMGEYLTTDCTVADNKLNISFANATRTYSRLRIVAAAEQTLTVTTTGFTPAGGDEVPESYTLTADDKGSAYLYGTFAENGTVTVYAEDGETELVSHTFTTATEAGKSYALDAREKEEDLEN